jgi:glutathione peroxidase
MKRLLTPLLLPLLASLWLGATPALAQTACPALLDHRFRTLQGAALDLCAHAGKPILVVNTASKCGYTSQFEKLEALDRRYRARGLLVVGFPSNDFQQEPGSNQEIARFCKMTYAIDFPMIERGAVSGKNADPFYRKLHAATGKQPAWNFHKYLIAPDGRTVYSFPSEMEPDAREILSRLTPMLR